MYLSQKYGTEIVCTPEKDKDMECLGQKKFAQFSELLTKKGLHDQGLSHCCTAFVDMIKATGEMIDRVVELAQMCDFETCNSEEFGKAVWSAKKCVSAASNFLLHKHWSAIGMDGTNCFVSAMCAISVPHGRPKFEFKAGDGLHVMFALCKSLSALSAFVLDGIPGAIMSEKASME